MKNENDFNTLAILDNLNISDDKFTFHELDIVKCSFKERKQ